MMKKIRTFWEYKWTIETKPFIEGDIVNWKPQIIHRFDIEIISPYYVKDDIENRMSILDLIWELEYSWIFDKDDTEPSTHTKWDKISPLGNPYGWYNPPYWTLTYCNADDYSPAKQVEPTWMFNKPVMNTAW